MTDAGLNATQRTPGSQARSDGCRRALRAAVCWALAITVAPGVGSPALADEGKWSLQLEAIQMEAYGHDQHVLTIHEIDLDSTPRLEDKTAINLETESALAYRGELQYMRGQWGWGIDSFWFNTAQDQTNPAAAANSPSGTIDRVVFEIADQSFTSSDPSEVLFYDVLEDTDLALWTVDLYGLRTLAEKPDSAIHLQFGLRLGDFDNDYRAVAGVQDVGGTRLDASSNYGLMMGPIVGLAGDVRRGRHRIKGYIGQSVLIGSAELTSRSRQFTGPLSEAFPVEVELETVFNREAFRKDQDVAIPITEFRLKWTYGVSDLVSVGVGAHTSTWWDVSVPPGVIPIEDGAETLHENTIVLFGLLASVELTF